MIKVEYPKGRTDALCRVKRLEFIAALLRLSKFYPSETIINEQETIKSYLQWAEILAKNFIHVYMKYSTLKNMNKLYRERNQNEKS